MYSTPEFRDMDGTVLEYGDVVVITVAGLPIGKLVKFLSCLSGSEQLTEALILFGEFLSCLSGSERLIYTNTSALIFLSCLSGSEQ